MGTTFLTGASSGIGRSLARRIAAAGDPIALIARRKELLDTLVAEIESAGGRALAIPCDVTDLEAVRSAVRATEEAFGPIGCLVANAGMPESTNVEDFRAEHVARLLDVNVLGVANCIEAVLPGMLARGAGHLVATSSLAAARGLPTSAAYCASKAALTVLMEGLRVDLSRSGVDVTVIAPGFVNVKPKRKKKKKNRPFRMEVEPATALIHRAIRRRKAYYAFPWTLVALVRLGQLLPSGLYDRLLGGRGPKVRPSA
jgi:NADP-dependent 3-hydroxy acid dehydrogenase YdfG